MDKSTTMVRIIQIVAMFLSTLVPFWFWTFSGGWITAKLFLTLAVTSYLLAISSLYWVPVIWKFPKIIEVTIKAIAKTVKNIALKREALEGKHIKKLYEALARNRQRALESLEEELKDCQDIKGAEGFVEQGAQQFKMVQKEFENLRCLLDAKLNAGELSHMKFVGTAKQVCLAVLDNLKYVTAILKSISTIDEEYIKSHLKELAKLKNPADADKKEVETLNERRKLRESQLEKVNVLLTENEEALTQINQVSVAIADMNLDRGEPLADLESTRKDLQDLVVSRRKLNYNRT